MADNNRIGALWKKRTRDGKQFLAGNIEVDGKKIPIVVFANDRKTEERFPDYNILPGRDRDAALQQVAPPPGEAEDIPW